MTISMAEVEIAVGVATVGAMASRVSTCVSNYAAVLTTGRIWLTGVSRWISTLSRTISGPLTTTSAIGCGDRRANFVVGVEGAFCCVEKTFGISFEISRGRTFSLTDGGGTHRT